MRTAAELARHLRAEWYRHGLHNVYARGNNVNRMTAAELRRQVKAFQGVLMDAARKEEDDPPGTPLGMWVESSE